MGPCEFFKYCQKIKKWGLDRTIKVLDRALLIRRRQYYNITGKWPHNEKPAAG
uniref:Uncharacterized protein n=1 Tax=viral metagenome TaxID=1070528 RepID=A0A6M3JQ11_9ZZZZ